MYCYRRFLICCELIFPQNTLIFLKRPTSIRKFFENYSGIKSKLSNTHTHTHSPTSTFKQKQIHTHARTDLFAHMKLKKTVVLPHLLQWKVKPNCIFNAKHHFGIN